MKANRAWLEAAGKGNGRADCELLVCLYGPWLAPTAGRCRIIWFSSSCAPPPGPCVPLLRVSCGHGARGAGCGGGVGTGVIAGLETRMEFKFLHSL